MLRFIWFIFRTWFWTRVWLRIRFDWFVSGVTACVCHFFSNEEVFEFYCSIPKTDTYMGLIEVIIHGIKLMMEHFLTIDIDCHGVLALFNLDVVVLAIIDCLIQVSFSDGFTTKTEETYSVVISKLDRVGTTWFFTFRSYKEVYQTMLVFDIDVIVKLLEAITFIGHEEVIGTDIAIVKGIVINIPITSDSFQAFKVGRKIVERDGNIKGFGQ